jgi:mRNA-degrading endonuclease RelE of RelBE toxin-antitoxin system
LPDSYTLRIAGPAVRALGKVPDRIRPALVQFMTERLVENPHRIGKPLIGKFAGLYAARVRDYRVRYRIDEGAKTVVVVHVAPRADAYRPD